jgi:branched-chain amino acid transport system ATP-binding protein
VLPPTQGSIIFDGEDVTALPAAERCQRGVGRTFQVVKSFETMTVIDNVIVGALVRTTVMRDARRKAHRGAGVLRLWPRANVLASRSGAFRKAPARSRPRARDRAETAAARTRCSPG